MYERISNDQFLEIMERLQGKPVWLKVQTKTIFVDRLYPKLEFLNFTSGKYQFGFQNYDEENEYRRLIINQRDIFDIHKEYFPLGVNTENVLINMTDNTKLFVQYNY